MKLLLLLLLLGQTADQVGLSRKLQQEALEAYRAKKAALFLEKARAAAALRDFVSDSASPVLFRVEGNKLAPFVRGDFTSLQGLAATKRYLYVSDYTTGLHAIDRKTRTITALPTPDDVCLLGVDGIYVAGDRTLIAIQNGANPMRVLRLTLAAGGLAVASATTLAANHEPMTDVTLGAFAHGVFHFIANGGWEQPVETVRVLRLQR